MAHDASAPRRFVKIAILTVSDTRSLETDTSGSFLQQALEEEGHQLADRKLVIDDIYQMRAVVSTWIADPEVEVIITTGGTGFTGRDSLAGLSNNTAIFCVPGSTGACKTGWNGIIKQQLDSTFQPCNFVQHVRKKSV